ncbi:MAG TPA: hypothetical protein VMT18_12645 [Planctomycetota bacterium]|nr:hypothetical protein [Planctomycetota bacterium]
MLTAAICLLAPATLAFHHPHDIVNAVALSPDFGRDGTVFCASAGTMNLFLVSSDRGRSWRNARSGMLGWEVSGLAVAPDWSSSRTAFAALGEAGLQRTRDGGATWDAPLFDGPVSHVVAGPVGEGSRTLAFAGGRVVRLSTDDGDSHSVVFEGEKFVLDLALSPAFERDGTLVVTTRDGRVNVSRDRGASWNAVQIDGLGNGLAFSPDFERDGTLWVATFPQGLQVSTDRGASFARVAGLVPENLTDVVVAPDWPDSRDLFVSTLEEGVFRSRDGGATWSRCGLDIALSDQGWSHYNHLALSPDWPADPTVYCAAFEGLYESRDGGATWTEAILDSTNIGRHVRFSPGFARDATAVALTYGNPCLVSEDGGDTWDMRSRGIDVMSTYAIGISPAFERDGLLLLGAERGLRRSRDRGRTWETIRLEAPGASRKGWAYEVRTILFSPRFEADRGVLALSEAGLFLSDDAGERWRRVEVPEERARRLAVAPGWPADARLFVGGESLRRSDDGGVTWSEPLGGGELVAVACAPDLAESGEVFALSMRQGFLRSEDGGRSFVPVPGALGGFSPSKLRLSSDFAADGTLWVSTLSGGMRVSRDRGHSFEPLLPLGSAVDTVFDFDLSPDFARDRTALACTHEGIVRSTDGGATWELVTREALWDEHRDPWLLRGPGWESLGAADAFVFGEHRSNRAGDSAVLPFAGSRVALIGSRGPDHGRLRVLLDGREVARVDAWAAAFEPCVTLFDSGDLEPAFHDLRVEVTGQADPRASDAWVHVDAARVRFEPELAGRLPDRADRSALTLGPDVSYGRDVRGGLPAHGTSEGAQVVQGGGWWPRSAWLGLAALLTVALVVRRRSARAR